MTNPQHIAIKVYEEIKRGEAVAYKNNPVPPTIEEIDGKYYIVTVLKRSK